jgi:type I restriction enzyme S subunit
MENNLPNGWIETSLNDLLIALESGSRPKGGVRGISEGIPSVGGEHLAYEGGFNFQNIKFVPKNFADAMSKGRIQRNDILIVKDGATTGKTSFVDKDFPYKNAVVNEHVFICRPSKELNPRFLFWYLWSQEGNKRILENFQGSAQGGINQTFTSNTTVPLAPLAEQHRIVTKLDVLLARVANCKNRLEKIPALLKNFRQSVLAAAVSGELTKQWKEELSEEKQEWKLKKAEEVCELITKGTTPINGGLLNEGEIPYLKVYNIVEQKIDFDYKPQFVTRETHEKFLRRSRVYPGDVLMNIVGPPLGKVAIVSNQYSEWNINQAIAFFRAKKEILPEFIFLILNGGTPIREIEREFRGTAGQSNISLEQCRNFDFPVPSIEEQKEIVRKVEELFHFADSIEARYQKAKAWFDKLPQAILAKAFRGELVEQHENDEPVSVLLEKIKKEKQNTNKPKQTAKRKKVYEENEGVSLAAEE